MKRLLFSLALLLMGTSGGWAQFGGFGDIPIEITSESTRMEGGLAIAEQSVIIRYKDTAIYCEYAQYNPDTRDTLLTGNVRIYREGRLFTAERALYNLETKVLNTADFRGEVTPFRFAGDSLSTLGDTAYLVKDGIFTTSDSSKPDYYIRAKTIRIYPKDRVVFTNAKLYVGRTPVFWYPYLYQSLNADNGFTFTPGYNSVWGAYLVTQTSFPVNDEIAGKLRIDLYATRGIGVGFEMRWGAEKRSASPFAKRLTETKTEAKANDVKTGENWGHFLSYFINDSDPGTNVTGLTREPVSPNRYRVSLQDRTYLTEDIYSTVNINKLSDKRFLQDFEENEFQNDPNPDNMVGLTKLDEDYSATLIARTQLNNQFDTTERLPEFALDTKTRPIFGGPFFYDSETSVGEYKRNFENGSLFPDYNSFRIDTFHQISRPGTYFGWLSINPHVGVRGTYYSNSGNIQETITNNTVTSTRIGADGLPVTTTSTVQDINEHLNQMGGLFRVAVNANVEASFKFSKEYEQVQSRALGLDGLRHIVQPYMNASFVYSSANPDNILQFDRYNRSTEAPPIDFPAFNAIDGLDNWSIVRLGVRNRWQTRRDNLTTNWLEVDTFFDVNIDRPDFGNLSPISDDGTFSNLYNRIRFYPVPWISLTVDSQIPIFDHGFTQINTSLSYMINPDMSFSVGERYISGNQQFTNSNQLTFGGYYRFNDNWSFSFTEQYQFEDSTLESQTYQIHRDLSSWIASVGFNLRDDGGKQDLGILFTFTLKDLPSVHMPFSLDPSSLTSGN